MAGKKIYYLAFTLLSISVLLASCSEQGGMGIFKKQSPHEAYGDKLKNAGLDRTAMGSKWFFNANDVLTKTLNITIPYRETGYFAADKPGVTALRFDAKRGRKISINLVKKPAVNFSIYVDLFELKTNNETKLLASADTTGTLLEYEIKKDGRYIIRLQPELLQSGEYTLTVSAGPSLAFPVSSSGKPYIGSIWGDARDAGIRRHEGIDIFAPKLTPALAAANGTVSNVTENALGGRVVFFHPNNADYTLYYAHLDVQSVQAGQQLRIGDTVGLVGNTGNARNTPSHLHFGIYADGGAINPLAFIEKESAQPPTLTAPLVNLNATVRTSNIINKLYDSPAEKGQTLLNLPKNAALTVEAASASFYKVKLPNGLSGYISARAVDPVSTLRTITLKSEQRLLETPDTLTAPSKKLLAAGNKVDVLAAFKNYYLVNDDGVTGWVLAE
ncbi:M23 family metallopeptidase [Mucilaginibacter limnophilus]|uniref:M23 family metallopeptidase n=1 Tax=Mucilaginibacter limnophilus TaxID=1932778 RepID=A0A3S2V655_9SPHI|nr:M23 family metallopeptidase [Mucilaginibacter limnophilus]RVT98064.1 M23 family metallopeptidase [Mucilaginibacter limnophilus]